ncbi:MAG: mannosyltransferase [Candidatus Fluviicola riflensis]|nr:MAG: mannosyltransferase [Candidatus Fluviicola riflensis]OGS78280.1 MAG: mannosyltransferase [Candidatus Fluviicola riflensis]OGS85346.1 MAG: mannosyltransferase [Fluviicola sp. RIFCSPHIGHO2_01_FULL_43_53]OGS87388.1 MAG: mannosyltransferase [Fluviicola sp. RIFCSPHIGHO2_12_FULL_43_24]
MVPTIVFLTSYPPRECGIATFSQDLVQALNRQFNHSFVLKIAAVETEKAASYPKEVAYALNTNLKQSYTKLASTLNADSDIGLLVVQHEFGFYKQHTDSFLRLLEDVVMPVAVVFHTVLPRPNSSLLTEIQQIVTKSAAIVVMTENAKELLLQDYEINPEKVTVIQHGTHLVRNGNKEQLKEKYGFTGRKIVSTFGLISSGKNIETTLKALPAVIEKNPDLLFLVIGKTHPEVVKQEQESYRDMLEQMVQELNLENHVQFINQYVSLTDLLEYLQLTDLYLFTSKDPNQAVSGTFSYALSCGCPIISTPIPHALELLQDTPYTIVPFSDPEKLAVSINHLLADEDMRHKIHLSALHRMAATSWENTALQYAMLFQQISEEPFSLEYRLPEINLSHIQRITTDFGIIQFSILNQPDIGSGYTLDDNARALIAVCKHYKITKDEADLELIRKYLTFLEFCLQPQGHFLNYVDEKRAFTEDNYSTNLSDSNGRAIWALGYMVSLNGTLSMQLVHRALVVLDTASKRVPDMYSTRAMSFAIKGLYYYSNAFPLASTRALIRLLADRLVQMYLHESEKDWEWFESYMTYANSLVPEALLCAYKVTEHEPYRDIAKITFDFLLTHIFNEDGIKVVSNKGWLHKGETPEYFGEQPIDVAYTVLALSRFYDVFEEVDYLMKMETAFNWFQGQNHLRRIVYNPCTGGCCDGLEEDHVNLNQGAESTVSYLLARLVMEDYRAALLHLHQNKQWALAYDDNKASLLAS